MSVKGGGDGEMIVDVLHRRIIRSEIAMADDEFIDLMHTEKASKAGSCKSDADSSGRGSGGAFVIALCGVVAIGCLYSVLRADPQGIQICVMVVYTMAIPYIASDRFLKRVPWESLTRGRSLVGHFVALAFVDGITSGALMVRRRLPTWFVTAGRKMSLFEFCLLCGLLVLAIFESSWISKYEDKPASAVAE
jgi:hypothetical protein